MEKYRKQLDHYDATAAALARGEDLRTLPEDNRVWWTNASKEELASNLAAAEAEVDALEPIEKILDVRLRVSLLSLCVKLSFNKSASTRPARARRIGPHRLVLS